MKLYEINEAMEKLLQLDITEEDFKLAADSINLELADKAQNIGYIIRNYETDIMSLDDEIKRLQAKKQALNGTLDRLKSYLSYTMLNMNQMKIETPLFKFSFRKSESLVIDDNTLIPAKYKESVVTEKIDKRLLKNDFKNEPVPGCHVEVKQNLQIK